MFFSGYCIHDPVRTHESTLRLMLVTLLNFLMGQHYAQPDDRDNIRAYRGAILRERDRSIVAGRSRLKVTTKLEANVHL